jgi:hypothetical protein
MLTLVIILLNACTKTGPQGAEGTSGPSFTGSLSGHVILTNQYGIPVDTGISYSSVRVVLYNSNNSVVDSMNVKSSGIYSIPNVTTGIYTLAFRDTGYGQGLNEGFQYVGPGNLEIANKGLVHTPNFNILKVIVDSVYHSQAVVSMLDTIAPDTKARNIAIFIGANPAVSSAPANYLVVYNYTIPANTNKFTVKIPFTTIYDAGINSGSTAYFAIYGAGYLYASSSEYIDYVTGRTIYNALSSTAVTTYPTPIVMP